VAWVIFFRLLSFPLLVPYISSEHLVPGHPPPVFLFHCARPSFTRVNTTGEIIVLYLLVFLYFWTANGKKKDSGSKGRRKGNRHSLEFNLLSFSSRMQFWLIRFVAKYLNLSQYQMTLNCVSLTFKMKKKLKYFSIQCSPIPERAFFWKVLRLRPSVLLVKEICRWRWVWSFVRIT